MKVTENDVQTAIAECSYTILPSGKTTVCELILDNGFSVIGTSSIVDKANFNQEIGESIAYNNAVEKILELLGFARQEKMYREKENKYD